ncbi:MAG: hypothetical protein JWO37_3675 [Acidimicrobiales bacterium]|nr:hypothetical protein [Acidimicrobiales bacterium]
MLGGVAINLVATEFVFLVVLVVALILTVPDTPVLPLEIVGLTLNLVFPILFHPFSKTIWAAIDLVMRPLEPAEEADAALARLDQSRGSARS